MSETEAPSWAPCGRCGGCYDACTCRDWLNPVVRHRMERDVKQRHKAAVALAMTRVVVGKKAAA